MAQNLVWPSHLKWLINPGVTVAVFPRYLAPLTNIMRIVPSIGLANTLYKVLDTHLPEDYLIQIYNRQITPTGLYIWQDFDGLKASHQLLLQILPQVILLVDTIEQVTPSREVNLVKRGYTLYEPRFEYLREIYVEDGEEELAVKTWMEKLPSTKIGLVVPESLLEQYTEEYPKLLVTSELIETQPPCDLIINLGLDDFTDTTIMLGQKKDVSQQTKIRQKMIESMVQNGAVVHLRTRIRQPSRNLADTVQWLARYILTPHRDDAWGHETFGFSYDDFVHWFDKTGYLPQSRLNYKMEFLARQSGRPEVMLLASLISAYDNDVLLGLIASSLEWRSNSSLAVLLNIVNLVLDKYPLIIKGGKVEWLYNSDNIVEYKINPEYLLRIQTMLQSLLDLDDKIEAKIDRLELDEEVVKFIHRYYFPFEVLSPANQVKTQSDNPLIKELVSKFTDPDPTFRSRPYQSYVTAIGGTSSLDYQLEPNILHTLTELEDQAIIYPLALLVTAIEPQIALFL